MQSIVEPEPFLHIPGGHKYWPNQGQLPFHLDGAEWTGEWIYRLLSGGTGSGKTLAGIAEDLMWCLRHPGIVGYIFEPVYKMIDRIVIPTLNWFLGVPFTENGVISEGGGFHRGRMSITFYNGSILWLGSLDEPEQAEGANVDFIHVDEARLVPKFETAWKVVQRRLRGSGGGDFPIGAWVTTTPNWPGTPLHKFFEHPKEKNPRAKPYRLHIDDNKEHLPADFIEGVKRAHSGSQYKRFVEGIFAGDETATFDFDYSVHVDEFNLVKPLDEEGKPRNAEIVYGVDFGWTHPFAVIAVLFDGDRRAFVMGETYDTRLSDVEIINECHKMQDQWGEGTFYCDPSRPDTIETMNRSDIKAKAGNRNVEEGIMEIGGRLKDAGDGRRRLYVSPACRNLIEELQIFNPEKKGIWHGTDALRYCLLGSRKTKYDPTFVFGPMRRIR